MKLLWTICLLALSLAAPAAAQVLELPRSIEREAAFEAPRTLHVTDWLLQRPEGQAALAEYRRLKAAGLLPYPRKNAFVAVGDTLPFRVFNFKTRQFDTFDFKLMGESDRALVWVELAELDNGRVTQATIDELSLALADQTPAGSFNPAAGIIANDEVIFGDPPDVDGDGKTDVLIVDVRDNYDPNAPRPQWVAGFITGEDLAGGRGNNRDVLYLDSHPTVARSGPAFVAQTAAHEYHHLIHLNYDINEETLLNEGLSEWAEVANGYAGRSVEYLQDPSRYNVSLFRWSGDANPLVIDDYQRGGLFINYFADQFGVLNTGQLTRETSNGKVGVDAVLAAIGAGRTFDELLADFHAANLLNDAALGPRFGYTTAQRRGIRGTASATFDGRFDPETPSTATIVQRGAVQYVVWDQVTDLVLTLNGGTGSQNLVPTAFLFQDGAFEARALAFGETAFDGTFDRVALVLAHVDPDGVIADVEYAATWNTNQQFQLETIAYDDGIVPSQGNALEAFRLCTANANGELCESTRQANRFIKPMGGILTSVAVGPYYDHNFANNTAPDNAPRDFRLHIWAPNGFLAASDLFRRPGDDLFTLDVIDTRASPGQTGNIGLINFLNVDLSAFQNELEALPDTFYVGLTNTGDDINYLVMGVTRYVGNTDSSNAVSYLFRSDFGPPENQGIWARFDELQAGGQSVLANRVLPIRASFLVPAGPVAVDEAEELPDRIVLHQNFPNPFNPSTTISYVLPRAADVRLRVYDLLGRQVATLVEGVQTPGAHQVRLDASRWASGLYFYTIEAAGQRQTQRMVLIK